MTQPIIAKADQLHVERLKSRLPHALVIKSELGLDSPGVIDSLVAAEETDRFSITPAPDKKYISVQQIRDMIHELRTQAARRRIVVISLAEQMPEVTQNALLKILEEPADKLHFILESHDASSLLPTIISRCETLTLHRTTPIQDKELLADGKLDDQSKQQILFLAKGKPLLIRQLVSQPELLEKYRELAASAKAIMSQASYASLKAALRHSTDRQEALELVSVLLTIIRHQVRFKGADMHMQNLADKVKDAEIALKSNGNIKLALLNIVLK